MTLARSGVSVVQHYVVHPSTSLLREWREYVNTDTSGHRLSRPGILDERMFGDDRADVDLHYMSGADVYDVGTAGDGSWRVRTVPLTASYQRDFDSYDSWACAIDTARTGACPSIAWAETSRMYAPWLSLRNRARGDGVAFGFDYHGRWRAATGAVDGAQVAVSLDVPNYDATLAPRARAVMPKAFTAAYAGDLDDMTNRLLAWQYRYMWDYTRADYFPGIRMLGDWIPGAQPFAGSGSTYDATGTLQKVFGLTPNLRTVGADGWHRDYGWWGTPGDWDGPDWRLTGDYLAKSGMRQTIYYPAYGADGGAKVFRDHPSWFAGSPCGYTTYLADLANADARQWVLDLVNGNADAWGGYAWRHDACPVQDTDGATQLGQSAGFQQLQQAFLDAQPGSAIQAVDSGGMEIGWEFMRRASSFSFTDLNGADQQYDASRLFPVDKLSGMPNQWHPEECVAPGWNMLLAHNPDFTGDTTDPARLECMRRLVETYRYLATQGVVGRWVRQYHPQVSGGVDYSWFQRLSRDGERGVLIYKGEPSEHRIWHPVAFDEATEFPGVAASGTVTVKPKGLNPASTYDVRFELAAGSSETHRQRPDGQRRRPQQTAGRRAHLPQPRDPAGRRRGQKRAERTRVGHRRLRHEHGLRRRRPALERRERRRLRQPLRGLPRRRPRRGRQQGHVLVRPGAGGEHARQLRGARARRRRQRLRESGDDADRRRPQRGRRQRGRARLPRQLDARDRRRRGARRHALERDRRRRHAALRLQRQRDRLVREARARLRQSARAHRRRRRDDRRPVRARREQLADPVFSRVWGTPGPHTIEIELLGRKRADSSGTKVTVDGLQVRTTRPVVTEDDALTYTGSGWERPQRAPLASNQGVALLGAPGPDDSSCRFACEGFHGTQGADNWFYEDRRGGTWANIGGFSVSDWPTGPAWHDSRPDQGGWVYERAIHPGESADTSRTWRAPRPGVIDIRSQPAKLDPAGDGVVVSIVKNGTTVLGPRTIAGNDRTGTPFDVSGVTVATGDLIRFVINRNGTYYNDLTAWDPELRYRAPATCNSACQGFSGLQGADGWRYQDLRGGTWSDIAAYRSSSAYPDGPTWHDELPSVGGWVYGPYIHPGESVDTARAWVAPRAGTIDIASVPAKVDPAGDGVVVKVTKNGATVLGPRTIAGTDTTGSAFDAGGVTVAAGDVIRFEINRNGGYGWDLTRWDPAISYQTAGSCLLACQQFSDVQGRDNWLFEDRGSGGSLAGHRDVGSGRRRRRSQLARRRPLRRRLGLPLGAASGRLQRHRPDVDRTGHRHGRHQQQTVEAGHERQRRRRRREGHAQRQNDPRPAHDRGDRRHGLGVRRQRRRGRGRRRDPLRDQPQRRLLPRQDDVGSADLVHGDRARADGAVERPDRRQRRRDRGGRGDRLRARRRADRTHLPRLRPRRRVGRRDARRARRHVRLPRTRRVADADLARQHRPRQTHDQSGADRDALGRRDRQRRLRRQRAGDRLT